MFGASSITGRDRDPRRRANNKNAGSGAPGNEHLVSLKGGGEAAESSGDEFDDDF